MKKGRHEKERIVAQIRERLEGSDIIIFTDFRGLKVSEMTELRNRLREVGAHFQVVKNTLARLAVRSLGLEAAESFLEGPTAIAVAQKEVAAPARVLQEFARDHKALELKGGLLGPKVLSLEDLKALAELPSREELLARLLGRMQAPIAGTVGVLQALLRNLVYVLDRVREVQAEA